jgi:SAM-dependent methyltransferase
MNQEYWEGRYQAQDMPWEKGEPAPGLVDFLGANTQLSRGTVAVPGCGTGHDVLVWARAGFDAHGFDLAPSAIRLATDRARAASLPARFQVGDFLRDDPPFQFDWIWEHTLFCAIQPAERDRYVEAVLRWLKPGGSRRALGAVLTPFQPGDGIRAAFLPESHGPGIAPVVAAESLRQPRHLNRSSAAKTIDH